MKHHMHSECWTDTDPLDWQRRHLHKSKWHCEVSACLYSDSTLREKLRLEAGAKRVKHDLRVAEAQAAMFPTQEGI
jgi:hypothetical protein